MVKIALDAGHGLNTAGKRTPDGEREWTFNDAVVRAAIAKLNTFADVEILRVDDVTGKTDVSLAARTNSANAWKADVYVSCHHNAFKGVWGAHGGVDTFIFNGANANPASERIANVVHPLVVSAMGLRNRGVKKENFHVLREFKQGKTIMPAILTEGGFMDSTTDIVAMRNPAALIAQGEAIAEGLAEYFGLKPKVVAPKTTRYSDVGESHSAYGALERISDAGIITGYPDGTFKPNEPLTRAHAAIMFDRLLTHLAKK